MEFENSHKDRIYACVWLDIASLITLRDELNQLIEESGKP